jgi:hypothetical protein
MTVADDPRERLGTAPPGQNGTGIPASRTPFDDLADQAAAVPDGIPAHPGARAGPGVAAAGHEPGPFGPRV